MLFTVCSPLKGLLEGIGLLKDRLEVLLDVGRSHGCVDVDLVEGGLQLSSENCIKKLCCDLWGLTCANKLASYGTLL